MKVIRSISILTNKRTGRTIGKPLIEGARRLGTNTLEKMFNILLRAVRFRATKKIITPVLLIIGVMITACSGTQEDYACCNTYGCKSVQNLNSCKSDAGDANGCSCSCESDATDDGGEVLFTPPVNRGLDPIAGAGLEQDGGVGVFYLQPEIRDTDGGEDTQNIPIDTGNDSGADNTDIINDESIGTEQDGANNSEQDSGFIEVSSPIDVTAGLDDVASETTDGENLDTGTDSEANDTSVNDGGEEDSGNLQDAGDGLEAEQDVFEDSENHGDIHEPAEIVEDVAEPFEPAVVFSEDFEDGDFTDNPEGVENSTQGGSSYVTHVTVRNGGTAIDEDGEIVEDPEGYAGVISPEKHGYASLSYTFELPAGDYTLLLDLSGCNGRCGVMEYLDVQVLVGPEALVNRRVQKSGCVADQECPEPEWRGVSEGFTLAEQPDGTPYSVTIMLRGSRGTWSCSWKMDNMSVETAAGSR